MVTSILQPNVDYTAKDFRAIKLRLQGLIRSVFPEWTDFNIASFSNILLETQAYGIDIATFYQDNQARDLYWPTVTQRVNAIKLGRLINFVLSTAQPSTTTLRFSTPSVATKDIPIPLGTRVRTPDATATRFRTTQLATILIGNTFIDVPAEQAVLVSGETFISSGAPNQQYVTNESPVIDASFSIIAGDGEYLPVTSFLEADPLTGSAITSTSRVFILRVDQFDRGIVLFGNGTAGKIPEGAVAVTYKTGGGAQGNVDSGQVIIIEDPILNVESATVAVSVTNTVPATGGSNRVSVAQARAQGPRSLRVLERTVAKEDFEIGALTIQGVARAAMVTSNQDGAVQENTGVLVVVSKGEQLPSGRIAPAAASAATLAAVLNQVQVVNPHTLTFTVTAQTAPFKTINISTRVFLAAGSLTLNVGTAIRNALKDFFAAQLADGTANPTIDFGANIKQADGTVISEIVWSDVFNAIRDAAGVRKVDEGPQGLLLNTLRQSISLNPREFPVIGTISIVDADTGISL